MFEIDRIVRNALEEDIGLGDITTEATVEPGVLARAQLVAKEGFTVAGLEVAARVFSTLDDFINWVESGGLSEFFPSPLHS